MKVDRTQRGGEQYLALQALARATGQVFDQVAMLYGLEGFLRRLAASEDREAFVLKGGVLLAAYDARRPTRDADLLALSGPCHSPMSSASPAGPAPNCSTSSVPASWNRFPGVVDAS